MDDEKRYEVLDKVYEEGELFWDSADIYMDSEDLLGKPDNHCDVLDTC